MTSRHTSPEGLTFEYSYNNFPNAAYFSSGKVSIVYSVPYHDWKKMSNEERHQWRQEKYAQAMRHFNLRGDAMYRGPIEGPTTEAL